MSKYLQTYSRDRHFSKNGEDGVLREIFKRLNIQDGWFVEIGTWDGRWLSNAYHFLKQGWRGIYIEGDSSKTKEIVRVVSKFPQKAYFIPQTVTVFGEYQLDTLLKGTPLPRSFQLLSIDVDSCDWWIWDSLSEYRPDVVVIGVNSQYPPDIDYVQPPDLKLKRFNPFLRTERIYLDLKSGASFSSLIELGKRKGYVLVCHLIFLTGSLIFVRKELAPSLRLPAELENNPGIIFNPAWFLYRFETYIPRVKASPRVLKNLLKDFLKEKTVIWENKFNQFIQKLLWPLIWLKRQILGSRKKTGK